MKVTRDWLDVRLVPSTGVAGTTPVYTGSKMSIGAYAPGKSA